MDFSKCNGPSVLEVLAASWPMILLYANALGIGMVCMVRRPNAPTFSLRKHAVRRPSARQENR